MRSRSGSKAEAVVPHDPVAAVRVGSVDDKIHVPDGGT